jgi:hypothetical protein
MKIYSAYQKIQYRKIKRWHIKMNIQENFYKNFEFD